MNQQDRISYPIEEAFELIGKSRTGGYAAIASGELETYKDGKRRMCTRRALEAYVARKEKASREQVAA